MAGQLEQIHLSSGELDLDDVDPELAIHLLNVFWARSNSCFPFVYRPAFMRDMARNGPYFSKLLLNAIYFAAARISARTETRQVVSDVKTAGWRFRLRFKELLGDALDQSKVTTVQALLIVAAALPSMGDDRTAAWIYTGLALRMIIDLGLHTTANSKLFGAVSRLSDEDLEIRR